ncbi:hypothetical protein K523DRAFT_252419 [Schizophyllum commune Tattone D]|nr:hypothetical protein K523DRAFT_252419 [Schizophyllum commune Tattone D]
MNSQQYSASYAHGASKQPCYSCPPRHDQYLHPPSGSPAIPAASRQRYPPAQPIGTQSIGPSLPLAPAQGRPYSAAPYTTFNENFTHSHPREPWQLAYPSVPLHTPRVQDYRSSPATSTAPTSVPLGRPSPVSSTLAVPPAQSPYGIYQEFTPQLNIALDPGQMRLAAPCANLDRNVICSVGRVLTPGAVHTSADGRLTVTRLARVVCRCAITHTSFAGPAKMIPDEPSRPAAIPRHEVYHMVAAELVHEPTSSAFDGGDDKASSSSSRGARCYKGGMVGADAPQLSPSPT